MVSFTIKPMYILIVVIILLLCIFLIKTPKSKERAKKMKEELTKNESPVEEKKIKTYDEEYDHDDYDSTGPIDDIHDE